MKNGRSIAFALIAAAVILGILVLVTKLVGGAFSLLGGAVNAVLGIVIILALTAIVIWMFSYAKRRK
jgi:hypothetical protein